MSWPSTDFEVEIQGELDRYKSALERIAAEAPFCDDCESHGDAEIATKMTTDLATGLPVFLCADCAENLRELRVDQDGEERAPIEDLKHEPEHEIALQALGMLSLAGDNPKGGGA